MNELSERIDLPMMAAYVRGALPGSGPLFSKPLGDLTEEDCAVLLARVRMTMGFLRGVHPESLLDVGSGRGVFLFPFLREFPWVPVTSLDLLDRRVDMLRAIHDGGVDNLHPLRQDICAWDAPDASFDVVTLLEVLEHIPDVQAAVKNAVRLARRFVAVTVPSKPDDNPEHIHLLTKDILTSLFQNAGCGSLRFDGVPGHLFLIARKNGEDT